MIQYCNAQFLLNNRRKKLIFNWKFVVSFFFSRESVEKNTLEKSQQKNTFGRFA